MRWGSQNGRKTPQDCLTPKVCIVINMLLLRMKQLNSLTNPRRWVLSVSPFLR